MLRKDEGQTRIFYARRLSDECQVPLAIGHAEAERFDDRFSLSIFTVKVLLEDDYDQKKSKGPDCH